MCHIIGTPINCRGEDLAHCTDYAVCWLRCSNFHDRIEEGEYVSDTALTDHQNLCQDANIHEVSFWEDTIKPDIKGDCQVCREKEKYSDPRLKASAQAEYNQIVREATESITTFQDHVENCDDWVLRTPDAEERREMTDADERMRLRVKNVAEQARELAMRLNHVKEREYRRIRKDFLRFTQPEYLAEYLANMDEAIIAGAAMRLREYVRRVNPRSEAVPIGPTNVRIVRVNDVPPPAVIR